MNPILKAIEDGYSTDDIIKFISKSIPRLVPQINKAMSNGYGIKEILGFLAKTSTKQDIQGLSESQIHARNRDLDSKLAQKGLAMAGMAIASPLAANAARNALSRALPASLNPSFGTPIPGNGTPNMPGYPQQQTSQPLPMNTPAQQPQANLQQPSSSQPPINTSNIAQQALPNQAEQKTIDIVGLLDKSGLRKHVDDISKNYKDPKHVAAVLSLKFPKKMQALQKESGKPMEEAIGDYLAQQPQESSIAEKEPEQPKPIAKNETVLTPQGVGEVKSDIRNDKVIVEVNGKKHKVDLSEIEQSPLPEKDLAELYDDLINKIGKHTGKKVSHHVNFAGYDPEAKELVYRPWHGAEYVYSDIDPEDVEMLTNLLTQRKTTGENFIGAWEKGTESPIGAAMHNLIEKLKKRAKEQGKEKAHIRKYQTVYSAYEPAELAKKKKYEEERRKNKKK